MTDDSGDARSESAASSDDPGSRWRSALATVRRRWRAIALVFVLVVALAGVGVVAYLETPYRGDGDRVAAVHDREDVTLDRDDGAYVLRGGDPTEDAVGMVIYPGARVHPESYVWTLAPIAAERDVLIVIPEMPLNLAILDSDAADEVRNRHDDVDRWVVGGHSLGGAMACRHADGNPDDVDGLVLLAAYCDEDDDLRDDDLAVLSVQGTADGVVDRETERDNRDLLGDDATIVEVEGMNHAQFGAYGDQRGDDPAEIDDAAARDALVSAIVDWLDEREGAG